VEVEVDLEMMEDDSANTDADPNEDLEGEDSGETDQIPAGPIAPRKKEIEMTPELIALREKLRDTLAHYYYRPENVANRSPWGAMHYMLAYGVDSQLIAGNRK